MSSVEDEDELSSLRQKVESLNMLLGTMSQDSLRTIGELEERLKDQEKFNTNLMRILDDKGLSNSLKTSNDTDSGDLDDSQCITASAFTQTNLAIDPEISVKLSFISAGISSYGNSIEYSQSKTILTPSTTSSHPHSQSRSHAHFNHSANQKSADRLSPTSLNKEFTEQNAHHTAPQSPMNLQDKSSMTVDKLTGRPPTFPSSTTTTPSKQPSQPLKSILRTPTHDKSSGPLNSFSPSLSPIHTLKSAPNGDEFPASEKLKSNDPFFNDSRMDVEGGNDMTKDDGVNLSASLFMSPLSYDSSDADGSLQSMSLLNVTTNTTLASGQVTGNNMGHGHVAYGDGRRKKSPRRRRASNDSISTDSKYNNRGKGFESTTGTSGDDNEADRENGFHTPTKGIGAPRSAHTTGYNKKRVNSMGLVKLQHFSESKRTSGFWKERLGKRDLTSILSSPLSQKLF